MHTKINKTAHNTNCGELRHFKCNIRDSKFAVFHILAAPYKDAIEPISELHICLKPQSACTYPA